MVGIFSVTFALFCLEDMRVFFSAKHRKRKVKKYSAYACRAFTGGRKGIYGANQICGYRVQPKEGPKGKKNSLRYPIWMLYTFLWKNFVTLEKNLLLKIQS